MFLLPLQVAEIAKTVDLQGIEVPLRRTRQIHSFRFIELSGFPPATGGDQTRPTIERGIGITTEVVEKLRLKVSGCSKNPPLKRWGTQRQVTPRPLAGAGPDAKGNRL